MRLCVLLCLCSLLCVSTVSTVSLQVVPPLVQFFSGQSIVLSCIEDTGGWRVRRRTSSGLSGVSCVRGLDDSCLLSSPSVSDTGSYWCEHLTEDKTAEVFITVTDLDLILDSPVLPVEAGSNVSLHCRSRPGLVLDPQIYRDGPMIQSEPLNIHQPVYFISNISKLHEGTYSCSALKNGLTVRSAERQLTVTDAVSPFSPDTSPEFSVSVEWVVRCLLVGSPYCVCTVFFIWIYIYYSQHSSGSRRTLKPEADFTTEHHF